MLSPEGDNVRYFPGVTAETLSAHIQENIDPPLDDYSSFVPETTEIPMHINRAHRHVLPDGTVAIAPPDTDKAAILRVENVMAARRLLEEGAALRTNSLLKEEAAAADAWQFADQQRGYDIAQPQPLLFKARLFSKATLGVIRQRINDRRGYF